MENVFDYEDIQLIPEKCIVKSRKECDTSIEFGGRKFRLPVVPSNMQTIIDEKIAIYLAENDYFYIMHRFKPETRLDFVKEMQERGLYASISVGVKEEEFDFIIELADAGLTPEYITIDIAHGHADTVISMIKHIKKYLPNSFVIAGNVGTPQAVRDLEQAGADATKVGIGPGKVCITKIKTGFGTGGWQLAALRWCAKAATKPVIADGGIRTHGDIAKSIRFGASMVMIGSLFAGSRASSTSSARSARSSSSWRSRWASTASSATPTASQRATRCWSRSMSCRRRPTGSSPDSPTSGSACCGSPPSSLHWARR